MVRSAHILGGAVLLLWSSAVSAQYRRASGDTIRVREQTTGTTSVSTPNGIVELRSTHDATIALTFGRADSALAWYEALSISMRSPQGQLEPGTTDALRRPFTLRFDDRGRIETLSVPSFPAAFNGVSDLSHQFDDLFPRLPEQPLRLGLSWSDSTMVESSDDGPKRSRHIRTIVSRVVRDTTIDGERAWVIESAQKHSVSSTQPLDGQPMTVRTQLTGADSGIVVFSQTHARLLGLRRTGSLSGTMTYEGGPQPVSLPLRQQYQNAVTRVP